MAYPPDPVETRGTQKPHSVQDDFALARRGIQGFRDPLNPSAALNALQRIEEQLEAAQRETREEWQQAERFRWELAETKEQLEAAREALFDCYVASGADTDGARKLSDMGRINPPIEVLAVRAVWDLRRDYDDDPNPASERDS